MVVCCCLCFHLDTLVQTQQSGVKPVTLLNPNDFILTSKGRWTRFLTYIHRDDSCQANFIVFKFSNGKDLKVTGDHLLCIHDSSGNRSNQKIYKKGRDVRQGESMFHYNDEGMEEVVKVVEISMETGTGVYAPLTTTGHFLANGFLVTCYSDVQTFIIPHLSMAPLRVWSRAKFWLTNLKNVDIHQTKRNETLEKVGIHAYANMLMKFRKSLLPLCLRNRL